MSEYDALAAREEFERERKTETDASSRAFPRFIPHGTRCQADDGRGGEFGQCSDSAVGIAVTDKGERWVCEFHFTHWDGQKMRGSHG